MTFSETMLARWEYAEYVAVLFVILGVVGEYVADFTNWLTGGDEARKRRLGKISTLVLIAALAVELVCLVKTNSTSGQIIASLTKDVEDERLEGLRIKSSLTARQLSAKQVEAMAASLSKLGPMPLDVFVFDDDEWSRFETLKFAQSLASALDNAGFDTRSYAGFGCRVMRPLVGVDVSFSRPVNRDEQVAGIEIRRFLGSSESGVELSYFPLDFPTCIGYSGVTVPDPKKPSRRFWTPIRIVIGSKPPAMLNRSARRTLGSATPAK